MHVYSYLEGWNYIDSLYFTVVTITTIGYGDMYPVSVLGKIFTIIFPFLGIAITFYFFSAVGKYVFRRTFETELQEHHDKIIAHFGKPVKSKKKKSPFI